MTETRFKAWGIQNNILREKKRTLGIFAGKRGGKTEVGAARFIKGMEEKVNYNANGIDPFLGAIVAPTVDMLRRLSWKKFFAYAKPLMPNGYNKSTHEGIWHDKSEVIGLSADNPTRIEGIKANIIWLDEVFQMSEQMFLECMARVSDSKGILICTGSLGVQYINPKQHWAHKYFKEYPDNETACFEWSTSDNPHFPKDELERLKNTLDPQTFRAMFELNWDTIPKNAVYQDFDNDSVMNISYNPELPTFVSVDWGFAHDAAVGFFQYDQSKDIVYMIDEIVESRLLLEQLYEKIVSKSYNITDYCCDIAGDQEREQIGRSNMKWFRDKGIHFKARRSAVQSGLALVRSFIKNTKGVRRFYVSAQCKKSIDAMRQYRYAERDGMILNENPVKAKDDPCDMIRYYFVNFHMKKVESSMIQL